jgi:hypothetical protein
MPIDVGGLMIATLVFGPILAIAVKIKHDAAALDDVNDMRTVPLMRLADAARTMPELVRVAGRAVAHEPRRAPISGRPAVACVIELYRDGAREPFVSDVLVEPFLVEDEGGRARVEPPFQVLALSPRLSGRGCDGLPAAFQAWVDERWDYDDWRAARRLRWIERRIEPGERVAVVGLARRELGGDGGGGNYREAPSTVVIESDDGAPLSLSDHPSLVGAAEGARPRQRP